MKYIFLDSEYYNSQEAKINVLCFATILRIAGTPDESNSPQFFWVDEDPAPLKEYLYQNKDAILVSFAIAAESRALQSIDISPYDFKWIDLHILWKQLQNGNFDCMYGNYYVKGKRYTSAPPPEGEIPEEETEELPPPGYELISKPRMIPGKHKRLETSLAAVCAAVLDIDIDAEHKEEMVQIILRGHPYSAEEREKIKEYCASDTAWLPKLFPVMMAMLRDRSSLSLTEILKAQQEFARFGIDCGTISGIGIPLNVTAIRRIADSKDAIKDAMIKNVNALYPFYAEFRKNRKADPVWVEKREFLTNFIIENSLRDCWPQTDTGAYKTDEDTLSKFSRFPAIHELNITKRMLKQIDYLNPNKDGSIFSAIGSDGRLRPYFNVFGTQTGRNAPPAKRFIFAMGSWLRSCILPPPDKVIVEIDYKSQEFIIAAIESEDTSMIEAYESGDPYLFFGKQIGMIPEEGNKETHELERNTCKSVILGLQYGLGITNLALKLSADIGRTFTDLEASELVQEHRKLFKKYWKWQWNVRAAHEAHSTLSTKDSWLLFADKQNSLSAGNYPVQGAGATVLRRAVRYALEAGLQVISPLHDAIYIEANIASQAQETAMLKDCMQKAFTDFYPEHKIGMDISAHDANHLWVPAKGRKMFALLSKYYLTEGDFL